MRLRHFVLTNFNVPLAGIAADKSGLSVQSGEWLAQRMELFERWCLPAMERRSARDAIWLVRHVVPARADLARRFAGYVGRAGLRLIPAELRFSDAIARELADHDELILTSRLDNDDALHPDALRRIETAAEESPLGGEPGREGGALEFLDLPVGYAVADSTGEARRVVNPSNQFLSLLERRCADRILTARCIDHTRAREVAPLRTVCREPMWLTLVHDRNAKNRLDKRLAGEPADLARIAAEFGFAAPC